MNYFLIQRNISNTLTDAKVNNVLVYAKSLLNTPD